MLDGVKVDSPGEVVRTTGYRLRLPAPGGDLVVAAFGRRAIEVAARHADRLVLNLVDPTVAGELVADLERACARLGRSRPRVAAWCAAAVDPGPAAVDQLRRSVVGYLAAPGYAEMFTRAGFGELCAYAATRPHPADLLARVPAELNAVVGLVGDLGAIRDRLGEYAAAGVDDVVLVPAATDADPAGEHTMRAVASLAGALL